LTDKTSEGALLSELVLRELASFAGRVRCDGPTVMLEAKVAQTFALIVHELATNAAKYGALSVPDGRAVVNWSTPEIDGERRFLFEWREEGGPPAKPPTRRSFGSTLINQVAGAELNCSPRLEYLETGFRYSLDASLSAVGQVTEESPVRNRLKSEALSRFYDAWARLRGLDGRAPMLKQLKREQIGLDGNLTVAEINRDGDIRLVEVGHALTERLGRPLEPVELEGEDSHSIREAYKRCWERGLPCYEHLHFDFGDGDPVTIERLLLPFSRGGKRVSHVAGLVVFTGKTRMDDR
jgi:hypothetical protein